MYILNLFTDRLHIVAVEEKAKIVEVKVTEVYYTIPHKKDITANIYFPPRLLQRSTPGQ